MAVVSVRVKMVSGSNTNRVSPPKRASARLVANRKYFTSRSRGGIDLDRWRALWKETHSSRLPSGQIQPHQTRPMMSVPPTVISANPNVGIHWRLAHIAPKAGNGTRREKVSASAREAPFSYPAKINIIY